MGKEKSVQYFNQRGKEVLLRGGREKVRGNAPCKVLWDVDIWKNPGRTNWRKRGGESLWTPQHQEKKKGTAVLSG